MLHMYVRQCVLHAYACACALDVVCLSVFACTCVFVMLREKSLSGEERKEAGEF